MLYYVSNLLTRNVESVSLRSCQHSDSVLLLPLAEALGVEGLSLQVVLHDIGHPHVIVDETQLAECSVQC